MDSYQYDDVLVEGWEKNATSLLGIPLHHTGEMDIYSAATRSSDDQWLPVDRVRERLQSLLFQMAINILVAAIFLYNIRVGIRTVRGRYRSVGAWCCLFSSTLGCSAGLFNVGMMLGGANCRQFVCMGTSGTTWHPNDVLRNSMQYGCGLCLIFQVGGNDSSAFFYADLGSKRDTEVDITETVTTYHERFLQATTFQSYVR
ncbi:hypothetical protein BDF22DRAFT_655565 [Syncephalis plumigaleata]|nr:hypothetical protein BDF22DRAFT_655565 [Syncephalis plumigaleata]